MKRLYWWIKFYFAVGHRPVQDDLERSMCKDAGKVGHFDCGWSREQNKPNFMVPHAQR